MSIRDEVPKMNSGEPVWQLPVKHSNLTNSCWIHPKANYHCFVNGSSLCGKYYQCNDWFDNVISLSDAVEHPELCCRVCMKKALQ